MQQSSFMKTQKEGSDVLSFSDAKKEAQYKNVENINMALGNFLKEDVEPYNYRKLLNNRLQSQSSA